MQGNGLQDICRTPDTTVDEELEPIIREGDAALLSSVERHAEVRSLFGIA
jgi:hypothetical protein